MPQIPMNVGLGAGGEGGCTEREDGRVGLV